MEVALSLGSNMGDRLTHLRMAVQEIGRLPGVRVLDSSAAYETEPVDVTPEHRHEAFLNAVIVVESLLPPEELALEAHAVEDRVGRVRTSDRNAPRPIDLDLLYAGNLQVETDALTLPHPRWAERRFVVQPLADVRPDLVLPGETRTVQQVLSALPDTPKVVLYSRDWTSPKE